MRIACPMSEAMGQIMMHRRAAIVLLGLGLAVAGCAHETSTTSSRSSVYENQLVRRTGNSAEDAKVYVVQNGRRRWIVFGSWIPAHGYAWPNDVHVISGEELQKIPLGQPITDKS